MIKIEHRFFRNGVDNQKNSDIRMILAAPESKRVATWTDEQKTKALSNLQIMEDFFTGFIDEAKSILEKVIHLQVGMKVRIVNNPKDHWENANKVKTITKDLKKFQGKRAFKLDDDSGIWLIEDFEECITYPGFKMK